jgi:hypothetical protein
MPGWAFAIIAVAVGIGVMAVVSILAITFLGESASSKFESVGTAVDDDGFFDADPDIFDPDAQTYGDDPSLDALWDRCEDGSGSACDDLFWQSPIDSEYETFGNTCGRRFDEDDVPFSCADAIGD